MDLDLQRRLRRGLVVDLERRVAAMPKRSSEQLLELAAQLVAVVARAPTTTWADSAGNPEVTSQTCRSWTSTTPGWAASAWPIWSGSRPAGAASMNTRPDAFSSP